MRAFFLFLFLSAGTAWAETCPAPPDRSAERGALFDRLRSAESQMAADRITDEIWAFWKTAPDTRAQALLDRSQERIFARDPDAAMAALDELVAYCPDYAEGWNQRATLRFILRDLEGSLADIDRVMALEPRHFGALAGKATILSRQGHADEAQAVLRLAVTIHPWLHERRSLRAVPGTDL